MWLVSKVVCGYFLGMYSKKFLKLNLMLSQTPFQLFGLVHEIHNGEDILIEGMKPFTEVYLGFEPNFRKSEDIIILQNMLEDFTRSLKVYTIGNINFFSGMDVDKYFKLFTEIEEDEFILQLT